MLINASNLKTGGGLQVASSIISQLRNYEEFSFIVVISKELTDWANLSENRNFPGVRFIRYSVPLRFNVITGKDKFLDEVVRKECVQSVISIFGPTYWKPEVYHIAGFAKPHYVYPEFIPNKLYTQFELLTLMLKKCVHLNDISRNTSAVFTETSDVTNRLRLILPSKIVTTISNTYHQIFQDPRSWDKKVAEQIGEYKTIFMVGSPYPHKNFQIIPKVIEVLRTRYPSLNYKFVLTINKKELKVSDPVVYENILFLGRVKMEELPPIYDKVNLVLHPSLLECFSATYVEAMFMGVPLIASDRPFARVVCQNAAYYCDPFNPSDIADKIHLLLEDEDAGTKLINEGYQQIKQHNDAEKRLEKILELIP